ncbi:hypothetical protein KVR01_001632 [Diaporthe batatas]|uniref:uncharacterized protein n=1 Tax=Diaporthe batatas TaxID=748121 RepID=UPI001D04E4F4|nr:uncharacterized protein KVR01_001632 [Diaporthe batatas]KAG8168883.1 hypothetical protein KVR01_001632 [Diaporthe batatas]
MVLKVFEQPQSPVTMEQELDVLILGAGWTATFLIPLLGERNMTFAATTSDGRHVAGSQTLKWRFDPTAPDPEQTKAFSLLPRARHVLITFPLKGKGQSAVLTSAYKQTHGGDGAGTGTFRFIQLGSTGIWQQDPEQAPWLDRRSPYKADDQRAVAEDELLGLGGCVLNLAGLWGGERDMRNWVDRVATTKEAVKGKTSLHMVHGVDVARVIAGVIQAGRGGKDSDSSSSGWDSVGRGQRWMVTDGFVYDWWSLFASWSSIGEDGSKPTKQAKWVYELMQEGGVRALPRSMEALGRCYDTRELWQTLSITPLKAGLGL